MTDTVKTESKTFTVEGVEFTGQDIPGWAVEHMGVDDRGMPIRQVRQTFPGGEAIAYQGDWIATFPSGQQVILRRATWLGEKATAYTVINGTRVAVNEPLTTVRETVTEVVPVNPIGAAGWPSKIVTHEIVTPVDPNAPIVAAFDPLASQAELDAQFTEAEGATRYNQDTGLRQTYTASGGWQNDPIAPIT